MISIHAPLTGSDVLLAGQKVVTEVFQSTLPLRGATADRIAARRRPGFQSTLPLRGATITQRLNQNGFTFQSTLPLRGATE